ncbi:hypothetical protein GN156_03165 [bacterium LRH843]|nr:hypothetical protein [bacterium LRH843]
MEREKHTISVRFNGKEQIVREVPNEVGAAGKEFDETIIPRPDNVIDFGKIQEERRLNGQPYWDDGNRENSPKLPYKRKKKSFFEGRKTNFPFILVGAIFSAIAVGLCLGFMVLTIFTGQLGEGSEASVGVRGLDASATAEAVTPTIPAVIPKETNLPSLAVEVVQGGAFTDAVKGTEIVNQLKEKGFAATLTEGTDPIYLFIGLGDDRAQATKVGELYETISQETYLKSYDINGKGITGQAEEVTAWFTSAIAQYKELLQFSVGGLGEGTVVSKDKLQKLTKSLETLQVERAAFTKLPEQAQTHANAFADSLTETKNGLSQFHETSDKRALWKTQQSLLNGLIHYDQLIKSLK